MVLVVLFLRHFPGMMVVICGLFLLLLCWGLDFGWIQRDMLEHVPIRLRSIGISPRPRSRDSRHESVSLVMNLMERVSSLAFSVESAEGTHPTSTVVDRDLLFKATVFRAFPRRTSPVRIGEGQHSRRGDLSGSRQWDFVRGLCLWSMTFRPKRVRRVLVTASTPLGVGPIYTPAAPSVGVCFLKPLEVGHHAEHRAA